MVKRKKASKRLGASRARRAHDEALRGSSVTIQIPDELRAFLEESTNAIAAIDEARAAGTVLLKLLRGPK